MDYLNTYKEVDTDMAWDKVRQRLHNEGLIPEQKDPVPGLPVYRRFAYAAALLVIIAVGGLGYYLFFEFETSGLLTLQTGADNSTFVQTFEDGSVVYMADNTLISYPEVFRGDKRKVSLSGEAFFDILPKNNQPFIIETSNALIEVLGTAFNLKASDNDFELIVEEGRVLVTIKDSNQNPEILSEWEMLRGTGNDMQKLPVIDRTYLSWRRNRMQFRDETLDNITSVISRNYNVSIDFEDDAIRERRLTVTFDNNAINTITEVIALSMDLDYEVLPDSGIIFKDKE